MEIAFERIAAWKAENHPEKWLDLRELNLKYLPPIPETVLWLNCGENALTELLRLPKGLKKLHCYGNKLQNLLNLPKGLEELECGGNYNITSLEGLPDSIKQLDLTYCDGLKTITHLPLKLRKLIFNNARYLTEIQYLPPSIKFLKITDSSLRRLPESLPESLRHIYFRHTEIESFPRLPNGLRVFYSLFDINYPSIPNLPEGLLVLSICRLLPLELPELPKSLERVDISIGDNDLICIDKYPNRCY